MAGVKEYEVEIPGRHGRPATRSTMLLSDRDLRFYPGAKPVGESAPAEKKAPAPKNKARTSTPNKAKASDAAKPAAPEAKEAGGADDN